jgi:hypothetical protein
MKNDAEVMADVLWKAYMREIDPTKRRHYGLRYAMWADIRDREMEMTGYSEDLQD